MLARIRRYRRTPIAPGEDPVIGCVFIRDVCFFPPDESAPPPPDFAANIVQGKSYDLSREPAAAYFGDLIQRMLGHTVEIDLAGPWNRQAPVFGDPRLAPQRLGQQAFKARVLVAYDRRCAITGSKIRPVLQAAHIRPVTDGGEHRLDNGLLLRSDVHTLFGHGYLGVDPRYRLHVSPRPREALSLNNLANGLGGLGRREEALAAIQEAVTIRRELAARWPDAYQQALEQSLQVIAWLEQGKTTAMQPRGSLGVITVRLGYYLTGVAQLRGLLWDQRVALGGSDLAELNQRPGPMTFSHRSCSTYVNSPDGPLSLPRP